jgi:hypothetical protein
VGDHFDNAVDAEYMSLFSSEQDDLTILNVEDARGSEATSSPKKAYNGKSSQTKKSSKKPSSNKLLQDAMKKRIFFLLW